MSVKNKKSWYCKFDVGPKCGTVRLNIKPSTNVKTHRNTITWQWGLRKDVYPTYGIYGSPFPKLAKYIRKNYSTSDPKFTDLNQAKLYYNEQIDRGLTSALELSIDFSFFERDILESLKQKVDIKTTNSDIWWYTDFRLNDIQDFSIYYWGTKRFIKYGYTSPIPLLIKEANDKVDRLLINSVIKETSSTKIYGPNSYGTRKRNGVRFDLDIPRYNDDSFWNENSHDWYKTIQELQDRGIIFKEYEEAKNNLELLVKKEIERMKQQIKNEIDKLNSLKYEGNLEPSIFLTM